MFLYVLSTQHLSPGYLVSFLKYEIAEIVTKLPKGEKINNTRNQ